MERGSEHSRERGAEILTAQLRSHALVQSAKERVESCWQTPPEGGHTIVPGQWVMIKAFKNKPLEPKWYGPHQVMLITAAAVLCQGRKTWTLVTHCKVVPPPAGIG